MFIHTHLRYLKTHYFSTPWCQKGHILWPHEPWGMPRSNTTTCVHLREGLTISASQRVKHSFNARGKSRSSWLLLSHSVLTNCFLLQDRLVGSRGKKHTINSLSEWGKTLPNHNALCSKAKGMRKWSIRRYHRKIHIFLLSLWVLIWGVEGCCVLVGSFGFIFGGFFCYF